VWTREGWLYQAVILDQHSRRATAWAVSNRMKRDLAAWQRMFTCARRGDPGSENGYRAAATVQRLQPSHGSPDTQWDSQYCSHDYQKFLRQHGFQATPLSDCAQSPAGQRMSGKGNCADNSAAETFFKTIKAELTWRGS